MAIDCIQALTKDYANALQDYCLNPDGLNPDRAGSTAQSLGERAATAGLTITELIHLYQQALDNRLQTMPAHQDGISLARLSADFLAQSLLPFEQQWQQTATALRRSEEQFRTVFDHAAIGIVVTDREQCIAHANPFFQNALQYSAAELAEFGFTQVTHPDDVALQQRLINECLAGTRDSYRLEKRYIRKDGAVIWSDMTATVVRDAIGHIQYAIITMIDTTAQRAALQKREQAETALQLLNTALESRVWERTAALEQKNAELEALFRIFPDSFFKIAADGTYLECKGQSPQDFYLPPEELVGRNVQDVLPAPMGQQFQATFEDVLQRDAIVNVEYALAINGVEQHYEARIVPLQPNQVVAIVRNISDRKRLEAERQVAQEALRQSEARFRRIAENLPGIVYQHLTHADGVAMFTYISPGCRQICEIEPTAALADETLVWRMVYPDDFPALQQAVAASMATLQPLHHEFRFVTPTGRIKWLQLNTHREQQANGDMVADAVVIDITDRKLAEVALYQSEARFQQLAANIPGAFYQSMFCFDGTRQFTYISSGYKRIFEADPAVLLVDADSFWQMAHPDDIAPLREEIIRSLATQQPFQFEYRIITPSGRIKWIHNVANRQHLPTGDIISDGVVLDITDRKTAEAALQASEQNFRTIFNHVSSHLWVHTVDGTVLDANDRVLKHIGLTRTEALQLSLLDFYAPAERPLAQARWQQALDGETVQFEFQSRHFHKGAVAELDITLNRIVWNGRAVILANIQDITDRKEAGRRLQYQADTAQLLATIAQTINRSIQLEPVLAICLEQTRQFLQCDRVLICHFGDDDAISIELEAVSQPTFSLLGQTLYDPCFGQTWAERYRQGHIAARSDIPNDVITGAIAPCYATFLTQIQVQASLTVAILQADQLWGLLIVHQCTSPRQWQPSEVDLLQQMGLQIGIASQKASLYTQLELELAERRRAEYTIAQQVQRERLLRSISQQIRQSLRLDQILATTVTEIRRFLAADRAVIFRLNRDRSGVVIQEANLGSYPTVMAMYLTDQHFPQAAYDSYLTGRVRSIDRASDDAPAACLADFMEQISVKSKLVAPILQTSEDNTPIVWGLLIVHACADHRRWQPAEIALLQQLATQVGIAIQQADLYSQIKDELAQKEVLLKEVHHRVKNNLQVVSALLSLQADSIQDPTVLAALQDSDNRLQAMALIHETLYQSNDLGRLNFSNYIQRLADNILLANSRHLNAINLVYKLEPIFLNLDTAIPCGLLLNELVTNAIKHAFPNGRQGTICLCLQRALTPPELLPKPSNITLTTGAMLPQAAPYYILSIGDDGIGLPADLNLEALQSLGLRIASDLAQQLRGSLVLERHDGTQFHLTFADLSYRKRL